MSEQDLCIQIIKAKIKGLTFAQARDIEMLCFERYRDGLEQGKFDSMMDKMQLLNWLESKNKIILQQHKIVEPVIKVQEVIDKIKEMN